MNKLKSLIEKEIQRLKSTYLGPTEQVNKFLERYSTPALKSGTKLVELLKRPELTYEALKEIDKERSRLSLQVAEQVEIQVKYEGYISRQLEQIEHFKKLENKKIPSEVNFNNIKGLRLEARQKMSSIMPDSVGQASRISGVSPADISVLLVYIEQFNRQKSLGDSHPEKKDE
jgi:tRNA uridine 5-carboxymethylaminomethyl modification enzyme